MNAEVLYQKEGTEVMRARNGVNSELFGYLHPMPGCETVKVKDPRSGDIHLSCKTHSVRSGLVLERYITK